MKRILLAEDDPDILYMLQKLLCSEAITCDAVLDGQAAISAYDKAVYEDRPYDLLTLDAAMPLKTGYEVTEYIRKKRSDDVPIVIVTAHTEPLAKAHADYAGATDWWPKPFEPHEFKRRVLDILSGKPRQEWSTSGLSKRDEVSHG